MCNILIFKDKLNSIQPYGNRLTKIYEDLRRLTKVVEIVFPKGRTGFFYDYLHLSTTIWKQAYEDLRRFTKAWEGPERFIHMVLHMVSTTVYNHTK